MGGLVSRLQGRKEAKPIDLSIDFNAVATAAEVEHANIEALTETFPKWTKTLENYTGCGEFIRQAISSPGKATEDAAWEAIIPAIANLKDVYEFAMQVESVLPKLIAFLCSDDPSSTFEKYQASAYQLAKIINFAIQFDLIKMSNPSIQNDFSYYRRTVSKMKLSNAGAAVIVSDELANRMSLFFAHSSPLSKTFIDSVANGVSMRKFDASRCADCFAILAGVAYYCIVREKTAPYGDLLYLRVMVGSVLFYDHIDPVGAFAKDSNINIKSTVKVIQNNGGASTEPLMNILKYSTVHLNAETTPKRTKALLA